MRGSASGCACHIVHRCKAPPRCSIGASRATRHSILKFLDPARAHAHHCRTGIADRSQCSDCGAQE
jgi:hypothetical protein